VSHWLASLRYGFTLYLYIVSMCALSYTFHLYSGIFASFGLLIKTVSHELYTYICMRMCVHVYVFLGASMLGVVYVYICACSCVRVCAYVCACVCVCVWEHTYVYMHVYACLRMYMCTNAYTYVHVYERMFMLCVVNVCCNYHFQLMFPINRQIS
jgi:hypothetical protein